MLSGETLVKEKESIANDLIEEIEELDEEEDKKLHLNVVFIGHVGMNLNWSRIFIFPICFTLIWSSFISSDFECRVRIHASYLNWFLQILFLDFLN